MKSLLLKRTVNSVVSLACCLGTINVTLANADNKSIVTGNTQPRIILRNYVDQKYIDNQLNYISGDLKKWDIYTVGELYKYIGDMADEINESCMDPADVNAWLVKAKGMVPVVYWNKAVKDPKFKKWVISLGVVARDLSKSIYADKKDDNDWYRESNGFVKSRGIYTWFKSTRMWSSHKIDSLCNLMMSIKMFEMGYKTASQVERNEYFKNLSNQNTEKSAAPNKI